MKLLVKLCDGKTLPINIKETANIESLKLLIAYQSNIPMHHFDLYWNDELLTPESLLLNQIEVNREKLPLNQWNVNNLIFMQLHSQIAI